LSLFYLSLAISIELTTFYPYFEKATLDLAKLKRALLLEGTQSSFSDLMLFEHSQRPEASLEDVEEVSNYSKAISYGLERLKNDFPLSLPL
jgi:hypothetical protein